MTTFNPTEFWRKPNVSEVDNPRYLSHYLPPHYLNQPELTKMVLNGLERYAEWDDAIMELGCNVGRNLAGLKKAGFKKLYGIEINPDALLLGNQMLDIDDIQIQIGSIEDLISNIVEVDWIFTQSVFMHLPQTSDWIYKIVALKARKGVMTIEIENRKDKFTWPRNYRKLFEDSGMCQVYKYNVNRKLIQRVMIWQK